MAVAETVRFAAFLQVQTLQYKAGKRWQAWISIPGHESRSRESIGPQHKEKGTKPERRRAAREAANLGVLGKGAGLLSKFRKQLSGRGVATTDMLTGVTNGEGPSSSADRSMPP
eukprot:scaffold5886_cov117-Isochrysis_galbana.AAC.1